MNKFYIVLLCGFLFAASINTQAQDKPQYAPDRVLVKLSGTPVMRMSAAATVLTLPDLGVSCSEMRLLNPSAESGGTGGAMARTDANAGKSDRQNNVYVLTLQETGENAVQKALEILNANPAVEIAEPDFYYELLATPNDPHFQEQWAFNSINAQQAWNISAGSKSVVVGIIDSGIDGVHPDLSENLWVNPNPGRDGFVNDIHGYDFVNRKGGMPTDQNGHGTHVSGIVGAKGNNGEGVAGVNWNVSLAWLGCSANSSEYVNVSAVIEALNYANNHGIPVTNNSYGSFSYSALFENAIRNYNGLFVAAAGNDKNDNDARQVYPAGYQLPNVISVAATGTDNNLWEKSNFGINSVHIAAPGANILSTGLGGNYEERSGTSMATPYVAGVAALMLSVLPDLSPAQIREILIGTARSSPFLYGFGILDAAAALTAAGSDNLSSRIDLSAAAPPAAGLGWTFSDGVYTIGDGASVTVTGSAAGSRRRVEVQAGAVAHITLDNAVITELASAQSPLLLLDGSKLTLTVTGGNTLAADDGGAGIQASAGTTLTIRGIGSLAATGGSGGAGIGGGTGEAGGNVTVGGGVITATGGAGAQGIGRGSGATVPGTLTLNGHATVIAGSVGDADVSRKTCGILFAGADGTFYGAEVAISADVSFPANLTIPESRTLTVPPGATLTIPAGVTLTNSGAIVNNGTIIINGALTNNSALTNNGTIIVNGTLTNTGTIINEDLIDISGALTNSGTIVNYGTVNGTVSGNSPVTLDNRIDLSVSNPIPRGVGWTFADNVYTVLTGADVTVTGSNTGSQRRIAVEANAAANITLNNATIQGLTGSQFPLLLGEGARVALTLSGNSTLSGCVRVPEGTALTVNGPGSLTATDGIGTTTTYENYGDITITGGTVTATGTGIGTNKDAPTGGTLTMDGNAVVFASRVSDTDRSRRTGGILFINNNGKICGGSMTVPIDVTIPAYNTLTILEGETLTVAAGKTLTNNGAVLNIGGVINYGGEYGAWAGNPPHDVPALTINLSDPTPTPPLIGWTYADNTYIINLDGATVNVTGTTSERSIKVANITAKITLTDATIKATGLDDPLALNVGANVTLTLVGTNTLTGEKSNTGILVPEGATLTINGDGSLEATGRVGIGGDDNSLYFTTAGNIIINSGTVTATGTANGAGIGGGYIGGSGNITINGGTVTAFGGTGAAGIGGGYDSGRNGVITINGGTVTAIGDGAGIGCGNFSSSSGTVIINGGTVTATGGKSSAGIGGGNVTSGVDVTISGGVVTALGGWWESGYYGTSGTVPGIGGGRNFYNDGFAGAGILTMNGNAIVFTTTGTTTGAAGTYPDKKTGGILVAGSITDSKTYWYGSNEMELTADVTVPVAYTAEGNTKQPISFTLTVDEGKILTIPAGITLTNNGTVKICGKLNVHGTWAGAAAIPCAPPALSVSPSSLSFIVSGEQKPVTVTSTMDWTASSSETWLTVSPASGSGNVTVTVTAEANTGTADRTATVTLEGTNGLGLVMNSEIDITQRGPEFEDIELEPRNATVKQGASQQFTAKVTVTGNASTAVTWSVSGNASPQTTITEAGLLTVAADETAQTLTITATSTFDNTKKGTATVTVSGITGWDDDLNIGIKLYPNPFTGELHLTGAEDCTLQVVTTNGNIVHTQKVINTDETINLEQLPAGIYLFRIEKDGKIIILKALKH